MASLNKVIVMGHLGRDPELRNTQSGKSVANFSMAASEKFGEREHTEWFNIVVWDKQAENCAKYLTKGRAALVEGRLQTRTWEDKEGQKRYTTEVIAQRVQFIGGGDKPGQPEAPPPTEDDVPF